MRITYYEPEYFESCMHLLIQLYNNEPCHCEFTEFKAKAYLNELIEAPRFIGFLLLNQDNLLIGAALCHERTWWNKDELYIDEFLIHPHYQSFDYDSKLLKYMEKHSWERELGGMTLVTNHLSMAKFYQKNGFSDHEIYFIYKGFG